MLLLEMGGVMLGHLLEAASQGSVSGVGKFALPKFYTANEESFRISSIAHYLLILQICKYPGVD